MQPNIAKRPAASDHARTAPAPRVGVATRGHATGMVAATVTIPALVIRADADIQGGGRPAALPSKEAIRRRGGAGR